MRGTGGLLSSLLSFVPCASVSELMLGVAIQSSGKCRVKQMQSSGPACTGSVLLGDPFRYIFLGSLVSCLICSLFSLLWLKFFQLLCYGFQSSFKSSLGFAACNLLLGILYATVYTLFLHLSSHMHWMSALYTCNTESYVVQCSKIVCHCRFRMSLEILKLDL